MLFVKDNNILTQKQLLQSANSCRNAQLTQADVINLGGDILQPDTPPVGDKVNPLKTATKAEDGLWYRDYEVIAFTPDELLQYKASSIQQVSAEFDRKINDQVAVYYPQFERDSWPDQRAESKAWVDYVNYGGAEPATPTLDALVQEGESKTDYANLILTNANLFKLMAGQNIKLLRGIRQSIEAASSKAEIDAIMQAALLEA